MPQPVDGVIFSLSYAVMPHHREVLRHAWNQLRSGGYVVIMDAKLPSGIAGKLLHPLVPWTSRLTVLGNPDIRSWEDLEVLSENVEMEEIALGLIIFVALRSPESRARAEL